MAIDTPAEIVAKKLYHRAAAFQPRDVFGMAVVQAHDPGALWDSRSAWTAELSTLRARMRTLARQYPTQAQSLNLLPAGEPYRQTAWSRANVFIDEVHREFQARQEE